MFENGTRYSSESTDHLGYYLMRQLYFCLSCKHNFRRNIIHQHTFIFFRYTDTLYFLSDINFIVPLYIYGNLFVSIRLN